MWWRGELFSLGSQASDPFLLKDQDSDVFSLGKKISITFFFLSSVSVPSELFHLPLKWVHVIVWETLTAWKILGRVCKVIFELFLIGKNKCLLLGICISWVVYEESIFFSSYPPQNALSKYPWAAMVTTNSWRLWVGCPGPADLKETPKRASWRRCLLWLRGPLSLAQLGLGPCAPFAHLPLS